MNNRKILFITAFTPSEKGAAVKNTLYMLRDFSQNFEVDVVYFKDKEDTCFSPDVPNIRVLCIIQNSRYYRIRNALTHFYWHPLFTVRYDKKVRNRIQSFIDNTDYCAILFDHSQTFMYARKLKFGSIKILLSHDIEAQRVRRSSNTFIYKMCLLTEKHFLSTPNAKLFALCQKDVGLIKTLYGLDASISLIYVDYKAVETYPKKLSNDFVMLGTWKRADNYEGAIWLLNGLSSYLSQPITVNIIGKFFPMEKILASDKVKINNLGFVDNPYPIISESKAMLCPLFSGAGIKVKVIDSLACGTPVIGTDIAFEGFPEKYSSFMLRCCSLQNFVKKMELIDISIERRKTFKEQFIADYKSITIPSWLKDCLST